MDDKALTGLRTTLADYFNDKARYRDQLAEKFPCEVGKHGSYASSLRKMAEYVLSLPTAEPILQRIAEATWCEYSEQCLMPSGTDGSTTETDQDAVHCGPRGRAIETADCAEWFASWAEILIREATEPESSELFEDEDI